MKIENESDLDNLIINQIEENIHLDYKASGSLAKSDGKKDEISRDVSSFANSNGGIIIYGIAEFNEKEKSFVEPYLPNHKLGIIHLASGIWDGDKDMRLHKEVKIKIKTLENKILSKSLRFGH